MKIQHLGSMKERNKSALTTRVAVHKSADFFGDCDGVSLWVTQNTGKTDETCLVFLIMSPDEARNVSNRLDYAYLEIADRDATRRLMQHVAKVDPFPGL